MEQLIQEIANLEAQEVEIEQRLNAAETDDEERKITDELNIVRNTLSPLYEELRKMQEKEQAVQQVAQAQQEHDGGLKEAIRQIFGAVCPSNLAEAVGLTEYTEMMQTFNQLVEEAVNENNSVLYGMIGQQIEAKDAKIQELTTANIGLQSDVSEAQGKVNQAYEEIESNEAKHLAFIESHRILQTQVGELNDVLAQKQREIEGLQTVIQTKDEEINRLREELNRAPASRNAIDVTPYKPSTTLQDKIADSQNRIKSALELALEGRQFRGKITAGETFPEPPALQFDPATVPEDDQFPTPEAPAAVTEGTFQDDVLAGHSDTDAPETGEGTIEERVARLEAAVFGQAKAAA